VAEEIDALAERGEIPTTTCGVLSHQQLVGSLEEVFIRAGIRTQSLRECASTSARDSTDDIVAYLRGWTNRDAVRHAGILNTPRRGIGRSGQACGAGTTENTGASSRTR